MALRPGTLLLVSGALASAFIFLSVLFAPKQAAATISRPHHSHAEQVTIRNRILAQPSEPNNQPWQQVAGSCAEGGAIFGRASDACGGSGTSFDVTEIFPP
ncbi:MAG: hypothetical protein ACPL8I_06670, partial [Chloroflexaceae bacterium]